MPRFYVLRRGRSCREGIPGAYHPRVLPFKKFSPARAEQLVSEAALHPSAQPGVDYPEWYLHRWHLLPDGYFSRRSIRLYEAAITRLYYQLQQKSALRAVAWELRGATDILELGCGPGRLLATVLDTYPETRLTAVDLSPYMLERARAEAGPGVALHHANSTRLPFPDESFHAVATMHHLGHMPVEEAAAATREAERVLKPGGRLIVLDHSWHDKHEAGLRLQRDRPIAKGLSRLRVLVKD